MTDKTNQQQGNRQPAQASAVATRPDPGNWLSSMESEFDRFFGDGFFNFRPFRRLMRPQFGFSPSVDVFEKNGSIVVKAELPGVKKSDVSASIEDGDLIIKATREAEQEVNESDYYRMERSSGTFYRHIPLPDGIQADKIEARYEDGVLEVKIPRVEEAKTKAVPITVK